MSTTPRTDAAWNEGPIECNIHYIPIEFARKLEIELAAEREKVRVLRDALKVLVENGGIGPESMFDNARDAIDAAMKEASQ